MVSGHSNLVLSIQINDFQKKPNIFLGLICAQCCCVSHRVKAKA